MKNIKKIIAGGLVTMTILGGVFVVGQHRIKENTLEISAIDPPTGMPW